MVFVDNVLSFKTHIFTSQKIKADVKTSNLLLHAFHGLNYNIIVSFMTEYF